LTCVFEVRIACQMWRRTDTRGRRNHGSIESNNAIENNEE
jgi:hypothetical protein